MPAELLCRRHLLGEHREVHAVWTILTQGKKGYAAHPETRRWKGKLKALYKRHDQLADEMSRRGYRHSSPLDQEKALGEGIQNEYVDLPDRQVEILKSKKCGCPILPVKMP